MAASDNLGRQFQKEPMQSPLYSDDEIERMEKAEMDRYDILNLMSQPTSSNAIKARKIG